MRNNILRTTLAFGLFLGAAPFGFADGLVNIDATGVAIQGFDPVAYFTDNKPEKGDDHFQSSYQGATYDFASAEHKALFDRSPDKYVPQFGGFCAYGVSKGHTAKIDPAAFQIVDGKLLLQYNSDVASVFNQDRAGNLKKAEANWPELDKKGK